MKYYFCKRYFPYDSLYIKRFKELIFRFLHFDIQILKTLAKGVDNRILFVYFDIETLTIVIVKRNLSFFDNLSLILTIKSVSLHSFMRLFELCGGYVRQVLKC